MNIQSIEISTIAAVFTSPLRVAILEALIKSPCKVGDLVELLNEEQAVISKQLAILKNAGFLECNPEGRCRNYQLANSIELSDFFLIIKNIFKQSSKNISKCKKK